jgi:hypothetical protein
LIPFLGGGGFYFYFCAFLFFPIFFPSPGDVCGGAVGVQNPKSERPLARFALKGTQNRRSVTRVRNKRPMWKNTHRGWNVTIFRGQISHRDSRGTRKKLGIWGGELGYGWVGHVFAQNYRRPGTKGFAFIYFLPSGMRSTQKVPGAPARSQANFPIALKIFKKCFWLVLQVECDVTSIHKNLVKKIQKPNFREGRRFRTSFFLRLKQIVKAVFMGVVASIDFFLVKHGQPSHNNS